MDIVLSIITVNFNGLDDTSALIDSVPFDALPMEMIVVDNGSATDEAVLIAARYPYVRTIRSEKNLGFAGGNNLGMAAARGKYIYLVNNDALFDTPWHAEQLIARLDSSPAIGMVSPKIRFAWDHRPIQFAGYTPLTPITLRNRAIGYGEADHGQYDDAHPTPYAHGAAMMISRAALDKTGMMPECYFLYYEELDWSLQVSRSGYDIWYEPACTVFHKESRSTGRMSALRTYYVSRNRLLFARRNTHGLQRVLCYIYIIGVVVPRDLLLHLTKKRPSHAKSVCRGVVDFIKMR